MDKKDTEGLEQIKYGYSYCSENYHGPFDTFEKAVEEGFLDSDADLIYVGEVVFPEVSDLVDVDNIIEDISVRAGDEFGEVAGNWPDLSKEECAQLENIIVKFLEEKSPVHFWAVENVVEVTRDYTEPHTAEGE